MDRWERRKAQRMLDAIKKKAKDDMYDWAISLGHAPTQVELEAWKAGYISGVNRATGNK